MESTLKHVVPQAVKDALSDAQKACEHEWRNTRKSLHPIVWVHRCLKCSAEIPM